MYRITGYAYHIMISFRDAGHVLVFVLCEHFCLIPCTPMSIVLTPPILLPHYWFSCPTCCLSLPPHLLRIYSPCVCSPVPVRCHMSSGCVLILPFPAQAVKLPVEFFPQGVVFAVCFVFVFITKYNLLLYWVLASSRTPDCCEHVRLK